MRLSLRLPRLRDRDLEHRITHQIGELIAIVEANPDADDQVLLASLLQAGVGRRSAMRLVVSVPIAFGRDLVTTHGVRVDPNIEIQGPDGSRTIRRLDSFVEFRVAAGLLPRLRESNSYLPVARHYERRSTLVDGLQRRICSSGRTATLALLFLGVAACNPAPVATPVATNQVKVTDSRLAPV